MDNNQDFREYRNYLEMLKIEFGRFLREAEKAATGTKNNLHLKARKQSIYLRESLKQYRIYSLKHEKLLKERQKQYEEQLIKEDLNL